MATPMMRQRDAAAVAATRMADADTPLIRNAWYVAARSDEIGRDLLGRWLVGRSIVLFRTEAGEAVALQNRCPHRSYPLSKATLDGDTLVCGYHGFRYGVDGRCLEVPSQPEPPRGLAAKRYPLIERPPFVWIWVGDPTRADPAACPHPEWLGHPDWRCVIGYLHLDGSYVHLHENLLDLSHLSFLHKNTFGTPEYARTPADEHIDGARIQVWRHVRCKLPALYARPLGWEGADCTRSSGARYVAPGLHVNTGVFTNLERERGPDEVQPRVEVAQLITPESNRSTHYYFALCRNFALDDPEVDEFMLRGQYAAFREDQDALALIQEMHDRDTDPDYFETHVGVDRAGVTMRRVLKSLVDAEQGA